MSGAIPTRLKRRLNLTTLLPPGVAMASMLSYKTTPMPAINSLAAMKHENAKSNL